MAFSVKDPALLKGLKPGDKVRFQAEMINKEPVVTKIEVIK
jgi:Cu/Ag efflux protein CusF